MHAFIDDETRLIGPFTGAPRWRWRRRIRARLRRFGRGAAAGVAGVWTGLIKALHESRSRSAARRINQRRHLIDAAQSARHADIETR